MVTFTYILKNVNPTLRYPDIKGKYDGIGLQVQSRAERVVQLILCYRVIFNILWQGVLFVAQKRI